MQLSLGYDRQVLDVGEGDLRTSILYTLAYADVFDFPLTTDELQRYLIGHRAGRAEVIAALESMAGKQVSLNGNYAFLPGRKELVGIRLRRQAHGEMLWPLAFKYGRRLAALPFVRMVAVTGALAADNVDQDADLDYLVITQPGYLWVTRAMILAVDGYTNASLARICPNFILAESHLALDDRDLFTAQELARMVPISGLPVYAAMRASNRWTDSFLPNAQGAPRQLKTRVNGDGRLKMFGERLLSTPPTRRLELWEMTRKIAKFTRQGNLNAETRFSADFCKGHFDGHKQRIMAAFQELLQAINLGVA
jgi:hypothetical protein